MPYRLTLIPLLFFQCLLYLTSTLQVVIISITRVLCTRTVSCRIPLMFENTVIILHNADLPVRISSTVAYYKPSTKTRFFTIHFIFNSQLNIVFLTVR